MADRRSDRLCDAQTHVARALILVGFFTLSPCGLRTVHATSEPSSRRAGSYEGAAIARLLSLSNRCNKLAAQRVLRKPEGKALPNLQHWQLLPTQIILESGPSGKLLVLIT